jgi:hypothetical protein
MLRRVTTTVDSLANIIQTLANGSMSGHLIARRENDTGFEEGELSFAQGRIVKAKVAHRSGVDALNWMKTWKGCTFSFHPSKESKHIPALTPDVLNDPTDVPVRRNTAELEQVPLVRRLSGENGKKSETAKVLAVRPDAMFPGAVPYRTEADDKALQLLKATEYGRVHRHIFLLVDGYRSVVELIRLTGRDKDEVVKALRDLEKLRVIHIPN